MKTTDFDYVLPPERIAQVPIEPRHHSRLLVIHRDRPELEHMRFDQLGHYLKSGDLLVINQTRVIPARIHARKVTGGRVELLLLRRLDEVTWETLIGGKRMLTGHQVQVEGGPVAEIITVLEGSRRIVRFAEPVEPYLNTIGEMPLPPYIHTRLENPERYQTVYAQRSGSAAAPTAGLHFTEQLLASLQADGIRVATVTLHVGLDTFAPVTEDDPLEHQIHTEWCELPDETAQTVNETKRNGGRVIAVGTTSVRTLESAASQSPGEWVKPMAGPTALFILPGFHFRVVDAMITNFHLPKSTLLMLVSAFAGRERILEAYREAIRLNYRFFSFGDATLIL